jgi:GT2 family glycosyltransferase
MMDLSIIIVSWNAKAYLAECLQSLTRETSRHHSEIIVVDNASTDGSPELVRQHFPHVKLICNESNLGFARANNIGIRQSAGGYVFLLNSDVKVLEGCFGSMYAYMERHPKIGMLGPKILNPDGTLQRSCKGFPTLWNSFCRALSLDTVFPRSKLFGRRLMTYWPHDAICGVEALSGCFWMVRREALGRVGLLDEDFFMYAEDIDWCKRFHEAGWGVVFFPHARAIHYGGASSSNAPVRFYLEMQRADLKYWEKHHGWSARAGYLLTVWVHHLVRVMGQAALYILQPSRRPEALPKIKRSIAAIRWLLDVSLRLKASLA